MWRNLHRYLLGPKSEPIHRGQRQYPSCHLRIHNQPNAERPSDRCPGQIWCLSLRSPPMTNGLEGSVPMPVASRRVGFRRLSLENLPTCVTPPPTKIHDETSAAAVRSKKPANMRLAIPKAAQNVIFALGTRLRVARSTKLCELNHRPVGRKAIRMPVLWVRCADGLAMSAA